MSREPLGFAVCVLLAVSIGAAGAQQPTVPPEAMAAIDAEDWAKAIELLEGPAQSETNEPANFWLGVAYLNAGHPEKAGDPLARAMRAEPTCRATAHLLARAVAQCGNTPFTRLPGFVDELEKAWSFDGDVLHAIGCAWMNNYLFKLRKAADMYAKDKDVSLGRAIDYFRRARELGTGRPNNDRWLALLLYRDGQYAEAVEVLHDALGREPAAYEHYLLLGMSLSHLGRHSEADLAFAQARRLAPGKSGVVDYERGKALCSVGRYRQALEAFRSVLAKAWEMPNVRQWLGAAAYGARDYPLALWGFIESAKVDERLDARYYVGRCAYDLGRYDLAAAHFQTALKAYKEKMESQGQTDAQPPAEWVHYLARAQWALGQPEQALEGLQAAFRQEPDNPLLARWLFQARIATDDLPGAIEVCERLGQTPEHRADAIAAVLGILETWPEPRTKDLMTRKTPHVFVAWDTLGDLYSLEGSYHTAAYYYVLARRTKGPLATARAGWALVHTRRWEEAEATFGDVTRHSKGSAKDYGRLGLACVFATNGRWAEAAQTAEAMSRKGMLPGRDVFLFWAAANGVPAPAVPADPYTLLGLIDNRFLGAGRGVEVLFVLPGSVLDGATPTVRPGDVLVQIGETPLGSTEQLDELRQAPVPTKPTSATVRRGERTFTVLLDYPAAATRLTPAATTAATQENQP